MKKIFGILIFILLIITIIFYNDLKNLYILRKEVHKIYKSDSEIIKIDMTIKTDGEFGKLEKLIKEYYNELHSHQKKYALLKFHDACSQVLELDNLKSANLVIEKQNIENLYKERIYRLDEIIKMLDNQYILSIIENTEIKKNYLWIYRRYMILNDDKFIKEWEIEKNKDTLIYELTIEALNTLINNSNVWHVENDKLYFKDEKTLNKYNDIVSKLNNQGDLKIKSIK